MPYTETVTEFFKRLEIPVNPGSQGVIEFQIEDEETYRVDMSQGKVDSSSNGQKPEIIVRARALDFMALVEGRMSVEDGLITQRLHVAGDMLKITQLMSTLKTVQN